jgi:hypothetical protein
MARLGGPFHVFRTILNTFKKKRRFNNVLHEFRRRLPRPLKNSTAQNWHKAAQKSHSESGSVRSQNRQDCRRGDTQFRLSNETSSASVRAELCRRSVRAPSRTQSAKFVEKEQSRGSRALQSCNVNCPVHVIGGAQTSLTRFVESIANYSVTRTLSQTLTFLCCQSQGWVERLANFGEDWHGCSRRVGMSGDNSPFAYVSSQFLQMINDRLWRLMLLGFDKIMLPRSDPTLLTHPTEGELALIRTCVEGRRRAEERARGGKVEEPDEVQDSDEAEDSDEPEAPDVSEIAVPRDIAMLGFGLLCEGDRKTMSRLGGYLYSWKEWPVEEIRQIASLEEMTGGHIILHKEMLDYLDEKLPPFSVNNGPLETITSLRDVLLAAYLHRTGKGTAFVHRHDWNVLHELWQAALPLNVDQEAVPWVANMGFTDTRELVHSVTNRIDMHALQLVDDVMKIEVPCFDDIPVSEILKYKSKDKFRTVVDRIEKLRTSNGLATGDQIAEVFHDALYEAFDVLRPKTSNILVAIAGAAPVPIVNPFSLWSIGQEVRENMAVRKRFDALLVLSDLRRMSKAARSPR